MRRIGSGVAVALAVPCALLVIACGAGTSGTSGHKINTGTTGQTPDTPTTTSTAPAATKTTAAAVPKGDKSQTFTGHSDKLVKLKGLSKDRLHVAKMSYKGSSNFIVDTVGSDGKEINNLANAIGHYTGSVAIDLGGFSDETPVAIKVQAQGTWTITVVDMATMPQLRSGTTSGHGPAVLLVPDGMLSGLSTFVFAHSGSANFIVDAYGDDSGDTNLVNEIGHFSGEEVVPSDARVITIEADGGWSIKASS
jgi:hypothetical protein